MPASRLRNDLHRPHRAPRGLRPLLLRKTDRFLKDASGVTAIEFAAVAMPFFILLFGLIEFGLAFFVNRMLDFGALEATRQVRTGQAVTNGLTEAEFKTLICQKMTTLLCKTDRLTVDLRTSSTFESLSTVESMLDEDGEIKEDTTFSVGSSSDIVIARIIYEWPMFTSIMHTDSGDTNDMKRRLYSTVVFRNEPYPW